MAQRIGNIYKLVTVPAVYRSIQSVLGGDRARQRYVSDALKPVAGTRFLDVGCGPAGILPYLPAVDYIGIDLNPKHIEFARRTHGDRGRFLVGDAAKALEVAGQVFDLVNVSALLHHLDDAAGRRLLAQCGEIVRPGGRIVTFDNVWLPRQSFIARRLIGLDSGLNVRTPEGYLALTSGLPVEIETLVFRDLLRIPYDHFSMVLTRH